MKTSALKLIALTFVLVLAIPSDSIYGDEESSPGALATKVKQILEDHCTACHSGENPDANLDILNHRQLVERAITRNSISESKLYSLLTTTNEEDRMPLNEDPLPSEKLALIRQWIEAGSPDFPSDVAPPEELDKDEGLQHVVGVDHVLKAILAHNRSVPVRERRFYRYFSSSHLLAGGASREVLEIHKNALAKAINHLSLKPNIIRPESIDGDLETVFAVDLREFGWNDPVVHTAQDENASSKSLNTFDLILLEYPYGVGFADSETYDALLAEFIVPARLVRPVPYVRVDWFVSTATQPPLYHDIMRLPRTLEGLEKQLEVDVLSNIKSQRNVHRAAVSVSGVSKNNRAMERHDLTVRNGYYWKSVDYSSSKGAENIFRDPVKLRGVGGEMIFTLPNGLQGYYLATGDGKRLDEAPTSIVTDKFASDKTVRNGLACMRCHERGMIKTFKDNVRPSVEMLSGSATLAFNKRDALALYPPQAELDALLSKDEDRFLQAMEKVLGSKQTEEPLKEVSGKFLDRPLNLASVAGELGLLSSDQIREVFRTPDFAGLGLLPLTVSGQIRRDMWEDYYDQVVLGVGLGIPIVPSDGLTRRDYLPRSNSVDVTLSTNHSNNVFSPGDRLEIFVTNNGDKSVYIELYASGVHGEKVELIRASTKLGSGERLAFPADQELLVKPRLGKEQLILYAAEREFQGGQVYRGSNIEDRIVHEHFQVDVRNESPAIDANALEVQKTTITVETK